ncbi:MAG: rhodanese-like domain-containing protein, partial [Tateyamaria sp.]
QTLSDQLGTCRAPILIDVCVPEDIAADPWRLPGAVHVTHTALRDWMDAQRHQEPVVVICQKGLKLSHGAASILRAHGYAAWALEDGNAGWRAASHPRLDLARAPAPGTQWILPAPRNAVSALAAWLIRRWFDPNATLLWVPGQHVADVAARFAATACDTRLPWTDQCMRLGLDFPQVPAFLDHCTNALATQLDALSILHKTEQDWTAAALTVVDAAWVASGATRKDAA